jgi:hypothetical protein
LCDDGNFLRSSVDADAMIVKIFKEVATVGRAAGYPDLITDDEIEGQMQRSRQKQIPRRGKSLPCWWMSETTGQSRWKLS